MGTRVYLSCTLNEELVPGHCLIVPIQHHLAMLEGDDDVWDEVKVCVFLYISGLFELSYLQSAELHEMPHEDVFRRGQGRHILRDSDFSEASKAHRY